MLEKSVHELLVGINEEDKKVAVAVEADNDKIKYYKGLLDQGVISADEFEDMKSKIKKGEL